MAKKTRTAHESLPTSDCCWNFLATNHQWNTKKKRWVTPENRKSAYHLPKRNLPITRGVENNIHLSSSSTFRIFHRMWDVPPVALPLNMRKENSHKLMDPKKEFWLCSFLSLQASVIVAKMLNDLSNSSLHAVWTNTNRRKNHLPPFWTRNTWISSLSIFWIIFKAKLIHQLPKVLNPKGWGGCNLKMSMNEKGKLPIVSNLSV